MKRHNVEACTQDRAGCLVRAMIPVIAGSIVSLPAFGDLDEGFGDGGLVSLHVGDFGSNAEAVAQQPDGKLVLAGGGTVFYDDGPDFLVARLLDDGSRDPAFGTNGIAQVDFFGDTDRAKDIVVQTDGKLVVSGYAGTPNGTRDIAVARFNADGTLDQEFGEGGKATTEIQGSQEDARSMVLQPDGKLVLGGSITDSVGISRQMLIRLNADGTLDSTFGVGGRSVLELAGNDTAWIDDIAVAPDGKLVALGSAMVAGHMSISVVRMLPNGAIDATFGTGGTVTIDFGSTVVGLAIAIESDSKVVIAGTEFPDQGGSNAALVRLDANGSLDSGFGNGGIATARFDGDSTLSALALEPGGKIVATGSRSTSGAEMDLIVTRFAADGSIDASFGNAGFDIADFGRGQIEPFSQGDAVILQADGKVVAVGPNSTGDFAGARFDAADVSPGIIGLTHTEFVIDETEPKVVYSVRRTGGSSGAVSAEFATAAGEAEPGKDFVTGTGTVTWGDGDASDRTITVDLIDDNKAEPSESYSLALSSPTGGAILAASEAMTRIVSEDGPGSIGMGFLLDPISTREGAGTVQVRVGRAGGTEGAVGVSYATGNGTAKAGEDYESATGRLEWADGERGIKTFAVKIRDDSDVEGTEDFTVSLNDPTGGATIGILNFAQKVLIADDDPGVMFKLGPSAAVHENAGSVSLIVSRVGGSKGEGSITISTAPDTAQADSDFVESSATLQWGEGDAGDKTFSVGIRNDKTRETTESFLVKLSNPKGAITLGSNSTAIVSILDDDTPAGGGGNGSGSDGKGGGGGGGFGVAALAWLALLLYMRQGDLRLSRSNARSSRAGRAGRS
jgi:uncharacterized delta-60 repeat protein